MTTTGRLPLMELPWLVCRWCPTRATGLVERWEQEPMGVCDGHKPAMELVGYVVQEVK
jgi:hypothetical protein